jgi:threonine/homoserine/homoserine lactone efflux protein
MSVETNIRWGWLKFMYVYTILMAGGYGLVILIAPEVIRSVFGWPMVEPISNGIVGSVYLAFGILSIFGLRSLLKFTPVLFLQLCYKSILFVAVLLPLLVKRQFPSYAIILVVIFTTFIVGDLIAIPFRYIFAKPLEKTS